MPLHDWNDLAGWEGMHHLWITELLRWVKPRLPAGYRAYIGSAPLLGVGRPVERPDVGVRNWDVEAGEEPVGPAPGEPGPASAEPDDEVAVATLDPGDVSPRRATGPPDRGRRSDLAAQQGPPDRPEAYLTRYLGYLLDGRTWCSSTCTAGRSGSRSPTGSPRSCTSGSLPSLPRWR